MNDQYIKLVFVPPLQTVLQNYNWRHFDPDSSGEKSFMLYSRKISQSPEGMPMADDSFEMTLKS